MDRAGLDVTGLFFSGRDRDERHIASERWRRAIYRRMGWELPGTPDFARLEARLAARQLKLGAPVAMRIFKKTFTLELWMYDGARFRLFESYPICRWSGRLGPKLAEGDRQSPEGFYTVERHQLNPNSRWHRSFNLGFPNAFDRAHGRAGSFLMVHGGCGSIGCYAITNAAVDEVWRLINAAFDGGQKRFQVQIYPFRPTPEALARYDGDPRQDLWRQLAAGYDIFEQDRLPPRVRICEGRYVLHPAANRQDWEADISRGCAQETSVRGK